MTNFRIIIIICLVIFVLFSCPPHTDNPEDNNSPVASIYCDSLCGVVNNLIILDGSQSNDEEDDKNLIFYWNFIDLPLSSSLTSINNATESIVSFTPDVEGQYEVQLTVTDKQGKINTDSVALVISASLLENITLSSLTLSSGVLSPAFNPQITSYTANVANNITTITIDAATSDSEATLDGTGGHYIVIGENIITITVTAADGVTQAIYKINVIRASTTASSDATLSWLSISSGTLNPSFISSIFTYTASVSTEISTIIISAIKNHPQATVTGDGSHNLTAGENIFIISVTAENGITSQTYQITITRGIQSYENILNIAGFRQNGEQARVACYWSNSEVNDLENNTLDSIPNSCDQENDNFFTGGYTQTNNCDVACYWENNTRIDLENNTYNSMVTDIKVINTDIYCCGYTQAENSAKVACYWVNGVRTDLENNTYISYASGISIAGSTIVLTGFTQQDAQSNQVACYWQNNNRTDLGNNTYISEGLDVIIEDSNIYIAGFTQNTNNYTVACYWRNGTRTDLANNTYISRALGIVVENGTVFTCGYTQNDNNYAVACFWQDTTKSDLENNTFESMPHSIIRVNNLLFISGYTQMYNANKVACYWEDGTRVDLSNNTYNSIATGLIYY